MEGAFVLLALHLCQFLIHSVGIGHTSSKIVPGVEVCLLERNIYDAGASKANFTLLCV